METVNRKIYYSTGLIFALAIMMFLGYLEVFPINSVFFAVSFFWNYALSTPGMVERINSRKYRFSFLRLIFKIKKSLSDFLRVLGIPYNCAAGRLIPPFVFIAVLVIILGEGNMAFALVGALFFELYFFIMKRLFPTTVNK